VLHAREGVCVVQQQIRLGKRRRPSSALEVELVADVRPRPTLERREIGEMSRQGRRRVHEGRAGGQRLGERGHRGQILVVHPDERERLRRRFLGVRDHRRHRLALVARHVDGEDRAVPQRRAEVGIAPREVSAGHHRVDARTASRGLDVHAPDAGVGVRRTQELGVQHAGEFHVGDVAGAAGDLLDHVESPDGAADNTETHVRASCGRPQATIASITFV
jgi:hypothetical protein